MQLLGSCGDATDLLLVEQHCAGPHVYTTTLHNHHCLLRTITQSEQNCVAERS